MNATPSEIGQIVWRHRNVIDVDCFTKEELYFLLDQAREHDVWVGGSSTAELAAVLEVTDPN